MKEVKECPVCLGKTILIQEPEGEFYVEVKLVCERCGVGVRKVFDKGEHTEEEMASVVLAMWNIRDCLYIDPEIAMRNAPEEGDEEEEEYYE